MSGKFLGFSHVSAKVIAAEISSAAAPSGGGGKDKQYVEERHADSGMNIIQKFNF